MFPLAPLGYGVSQTSVAFYYLGSFEMGRWIAISYSRESSRLRDWNQVSCIAGSLLHSLLAAPRKPCFEDCWVCVCRTCHSWTLYDIFLMSKVIKAIFICLVGVQCSVLAAQSCPTLCDPMDCSPPGSSVHGIFQARLLEWVAISFSRGSSWPRDGTWGSCTAGATREAQCVRVRERRCCWWERHALSQVVYQL